MHVTETNVSSLCNGTFEMAPLSLHRTAGSFNGERWTNMQSSTTPATDHAMMRSRRRQLVGNSLG